MSIPNFLKKYMFLTLTLALFISAFGALHSTALIKGKLLDAESGAPVGSYLIFLDETGKPVKIKSNSGDGSFQGILESGKTYHVSVTGYLITNHDGTIVVPPKEYTEFNRDFKLKKIDAGLELSKQQGFMPNDADITDSGKQMLEKLKSFLDANISAHVNITVSSGDSYFKSKRVKKEYTDKRGRKRYKRVRVTTEEQLQELLSARVEAIRSFFSGMKKYMNRIEYKENLEVNKPPRKKRRSRKKTQEEPAPVVPNITITVSRP